MFEEIGLDMALVTESWLKDNQVLARDVIDLEFGTNLKIIYKNRPARRASARMVGGGVSIIFSKASCNFRERKLVNNRFEMVVASGKFRQSSKMVVVYCIYMPPKMTVADQAELRELISDDILRVKSKDANAMIFIGGDLNNKDLGPALDCYVDISRKNFDPTRGTACLDILYSNASVHKNEVLPPLHTPDLKLSDHGCVLFEIREPKERDFVWIRKKVRRHTEEAVAEFGRRLDETDWHALLPASLTLDQLVARYEDYTGQLTDELFPLRTSRRRSNEKPWITEGMRALSKRKKLVYRREGKSNFWFRLDAEMQARTAASKGQFVSNVKKSGNTKAYYRAVKSLSCKEVSPAWGVADLFPGATKEEVGREVTSFFTAITDQFEPLPPARATCQPRPPVTLEEVKKKLRDAKKPDSAVPGDMLPRLTKKYWEKIAVPVMIIFNAAFATGEWPSRWKTESTVVIPKGPNPTNLSECRNISCTPFLSKVLESFLLEDLRTELEQDVTQYGGIKDCSVNHLLVDLLDRVLRPLDEGDPSVVVCVDFEKAFNRLDHAVCLNELRRLGASDHSLQLVRSFLTGRTMRARIGDFLSEEKKLNGGSPQGSILGCLLYCVATQQIDATLLQRAPPRPQHQPDVPPQPPPGDPSDGESDHAGFDLLHPDLWPADSPPGPTPPPESPPQSPGEATEYVRGLLAAFFKYVDDTTVVETVDRDTAVRHFTTKRTLESVPAVQIEAVMVELIKLAGDIGMRVNCSKTQMLCISPDNGCDSSTRIQVSGQDIESVDSVKLLGFCLGSRPDMSHQVAFIKKKFRMKLWSLIHLKSAGIVGRHLFDLYACFVRPVIETNSVIYHSLLTREQCGEIELMQRKVLKICFGFDKHDADIRHEQKIPTLEKRREIATENFVKKAMKNPRFATRWFVPRERIDTNIRRRDPFKVNRARTNRYMNSPLVYMQRIANFLSTT